MKPIKPSCHPGLVRVFTDYVPPWIRETSTHQLRIMLTQPLIPILRQKITWELGIREQMAVELVDPHDTPLPLSGVIARKPSADLSIIRVTRPPHNLEDSIKCYGERPPETERNLWYVDCRKHRWPWHGALPLGFETRKQAETAMRALKAAGLCTEAALHQRIKVDLDWEGVKRIMLERTEHPDDE